MVTVTDPRLVETVLHPASGTTGLLVEAITHLSPKHLAESILAKEARIADIPANIKSLLQASQ